MTAESRKLRLRRRLAELEEDQRWRAVRGPAEVTCMVLDASDLAYPVVRSVAALGCSVAELMAFLVDEITDTLPTWSRDIQACEEIERLGADERVLLVRTAAPVPLVAAREDLFYVHRGDDGDGSSYEVSEVIEQSAVPIAPGAVRSRMHFAAKHVHPRAGGGCRYDVMWQYDPMGWLSRVLPRAVCVASVHDHMKDECRRLQARFGQG
jgi:hypothetical protein